MELYEYARPNLFAGKKIMYVHGFASSGSSGTVGRMRLLLPKATVIAPDLPVDAPEALQLLKDVCARFLIHLLEHGEFLAESLEALHVERSSQDESFVIGT